jgi:hypothetical protein
MTSTRHETATTKIHFIIKCLTKVKSKPYTYNNLQRNLLKQIKRKVNTTNRKSSLDEDGFYELPERELRTRPRKNLEDIYSVIEKTVEDLTKRQGELETKLNSMEKSNEFLEEENEQMESELSDKKNYTNKLEALIFLILDRLRNEANGSNLTTTSLTTTSLNKKLVCDEVSSLNSLAYSLEADTKVSLIHSLYKQFSSSPNIIPYGSLHKLVKQKEDLDTLDTIYMSPINADVCETNVSSPTSLLSSHECSFAKSFNSSFTPLLSIKRKRTDETKDELESVSYDIKNKDSLFEEMTKLTPCLISSPTLSPREKSIHSKNIY